MVAGSAVDPGSGTPGVPDGVADGAADVVRPGAGVDGRADEVEDAELQAVAVSRTAQSAVAVVTRVCRCLTGSG